MQLSLPMKRLLWKDGRQILPLLLLLVGVSVVIHLLFVVLSSMNAGELDELIRHMLIAIPMCYSIGAAVVLISLEKESGQMLWLNGLPIHSNRVAASKLIVIISTWIAVWLISFLIYEWIHVFHLRQVFHFPRYQYGLIGFTGSLWVFVGQSLLVLSIGVLLSWRLQTTWIALVAIVLVEMIPFHTFVVYVYLTSNNHLLRNPIAMEVACVLFSIAFSSVFGWIGWRFAIQYWAREIPRTSRQSKWLDLVQAWFPSWARTALATKHPTRFTPSSALIWQTGKQHLTILAVLFGLVFVAMTMLLAFHLVKEVAFLPCIFTHHGICRLFRRIVGWMGRFSNRCAATLYSLSSRTRLDALDALVDSAMCPFCISMRAGLANSWNDSIRPSGDAWMDVAFARDFTAVSIPIAGLCVVAMDIVRHP